MPKPYPFPDPNDRSPNSPTVIVPSNKVLYLYNKNHPEEQNMQKVTEKVQTWFIDESKNQYHWNNAHFAGSDAILGANFKRFDTPDE